MKDVELLEVAEKELNETIEYYNQEQAGLGDEFLQEFVRTLERIREFPESSESYTSKSRRVIVRRFPYGIIYRIKDNYLEIVAVAHLHRDPKSWKQRLEE